MVFDRTTFEQEVEKRITPFEKEEKTVIEAKNPKQEEEVIAQMIKDLFDESDGATTINSLKEQFAVTTKKESNPEKEFEEKVVTAPTPEVKEKKEDMIKQIADKTQPSQLPKSQNDEQVAEDIKQLFKDNQDLKIQF